MGLSMCDRFISVNLARLILLALPGVLMIDSVEAADMKFSGVLISAPECTMSTKPITVDFGTVDVAKIENLNSEPVIYSPSCSNIEDASKFTVKMTLNGISAAGDASYLNTDNPILGIRFMGGDGVTIRLNTPVLVKDLKVWPKIYAKLYRFPGEVVVGPFKASGTITIDIQ
jgi:type 1 fimbria pilin